MWANKKGRLLHLGPGTYENTNLRWTKGKKNIPERKYEKKEYQFYEVEEHY